MEKLVQLWALAAAAAAFTTPTAPRAPPALRSTWINQGFVESVKAGPNGSPFNANYADVDRSEVQLAAQTTMNALRSKGRIIDKTTEEAAWEAAWIAASVANQERLKNNRDAAAQVAYGVQVPPIGGGKDATPEAFVADKPAFVAALRSSGRGFDRETEEAAWEAAWIAASTAPLVVDVEPVGAKPAASPFTADYVDVERREVELAARTALDALRSKGRGLDRAAEEAAWEAAWIAASVSNLGQLKLKQDAAAHVSAHIQPYVPPLRLPAAGGPEQDPRDPRFAAGPAPPGGDRTPPATAPAQRRRASVARAKAGIEQEQVRGPLSNEGNYNHDDAYGRGQDPWNPGFDEGGRAGRRFRRLRTRPQKQRFGARTRNGGHVRVVPPGGDVRGYEQDPRDPRFAAGRAPPGGYEQGPWDPRFEAGPGGDVRGYEQGAWDPRFEAARAPPGMEGRRYAQGPKQRFAGRRNYDQADAFAHGGPQPRRSRGGRNRWDSSAPAAPRTTTALRATRQGWLAGSMNYVDVEPREAAWKEKWSAASAANVEQRAHTRGAAARVADDVRAYVPPLGGRVAGAVDEFAADEAAMRRRRRRPGRRRRAGRVGLGAVGPGAPRPHPALPYDYRRATRDPHRYHDPNAAYGEGFFPARRVATRAQWGNPGLPWLNDRSVVPRRPGPRAAHGPSRATPTWRPAYDEDMRQNPYGANSIQFDAGRNRWQNREQRRRQEEGRGRADWRRPRGGLHREELRARRYREWKP
ncbi:hypothetical protein JL721_9618 [Aureococcus anophagefferens]|nr:hypothetical protein JL721_9618 [Aureococcus anophagefferens]